MHLYMHSSKITKKKIKFYAFIYAFFKITKQKSNFMHSYMYFSKLIKQKKNQVSCIHKYILKKN